MAYPALTQEHRDFFAAHGWIVIRDAVPQSDLDALEERCDSILTAKEKLAFDWAWDVKEDRDRRSFRIVQSSPSLIWKELADQLYREWLTAFGSGLMGQALEFWYDQFLGKPPGRSVPTEWHQDEGYWGRNLDDKGVTCWIPLQDVDASNGCMHFIDGGHRDGVLRHRRVEGMASDLLTCNTEVDERRMVVCPIRRGDVTFHHSKTPHMTTSNVSKRWRKAVSNHLQAVGAGREGGHYPWKVYVDQRTGEVRTPQRS